MKAGLFFFGFIIVLGISPIDERDSKIDSFLEAYTNTWNTHDGDSLAALFTTDADFIMGSMPRIVGRDAIGEWWRTYFSKIDEDRKGEFKLLSFRNITPDVRIVNVNSKTFGANSDGEELETRLARGLWVLVNRDETWLISAMLGLPAEGEQRLNPGVDR